MHAVHRKPVCKCDTFQSEDDNHDDDDDDDIAVCFLFYLHHAQVQASICPPSAQVEPSFAFALFCHLVGARAVLNLRREPQKK